MTKDTDDPTFDLDAINKLFNKAKTGGGPFLFAFGLERSFSLSAMETEAVRNTAASIHECHSLFIKMNVTGLIAR